MRISIVTLGCKTNQAESFSIEGALKSDGYDIVDISDSPDLCIINTCTVTARADQQSRQLIRKALRNKAKVIVTGCYSELNADKIMKIDGAIDIVNNGDKLHIINKITDHNVSSFHISSPYPRHRPIVKVQDGCNFSCSYCSIPKARGRSRSESSEVIIDRINQYCEAGYKEVVLTGIHLGTYGLDLQPRKSLSFLLEGILKETNIPRIRLSSLEINEINDQLLEIISDSRICKHLHIPLQSGDDTILRKMNRTYSRDDFTQKIDCIAERFTNIAIGTDVITGFPGESEESFLRTCRLIEAMPFSYIHVFPYSSRPGTPASTFADQMPESTKKQRVSILKTIGDSKKADYLTMHLNTILEIVVESRNAEGYVGTSANYIKVLLPISPEIMNETLINIKVTGHKNNHALGIPINTLKLVHI